MHLITGGRCMGKRAYAEKFYGNNFKSVCNLKNENLFEADLILNLHTGVRNLMRHDIEPVNYFIEHLDIIRNSVLIGDDINCGVIPIEKFERQWRDATGILYQELALKSDTVTYIWSGLPLKLKG